MLSAAPRYLSTIHRVVLRADVSAALFRRGRFLSSTTASPTEVSRNVAEQNNKKASKETVKLDLCGDIEEEQEEEMEEMLQDGPAGKEWGGPTRGGVLREPTRFGDWERKGRCSDF